MAVVTLKLHCNGTVRNVRFGSKSKLSKLHSAIADKLNVHEPLLTFNDGDGTVYRIDNETHMAYALSCAEGGVLHIRVSGDAADSDPESELEWDAESDADDDGAEQLVSFEAEAVSSDTRYAKRFARHHCECYRCEVSPIEGVRYTYKSDSSVSVCTDCLPYYDRADWRAVHFPWKRSVPRAPLSQAENYEPTDDVRHLQMLLTKLGYLKLSDTDEYQGSYQSRTARAVARFRKRYGVRGSDDEVYDQQTARMLAAVARERLA